MRSCAVLVSDALHPFLLCTDVLPPQLDPSKRATAQECIRSPWLLSGTYAAPTTDSVSRRPGRIGSASDEEDDGKSGGDSPHSGGNRTASPRNADLSDDEDDGDDRASDDCESKGSGGSDAGEERRLAQSIGRMSLSKLKK